MSPWRGPGASATLQPLHLAPCAAGSIPGRCHTCIRIVAPHCSGTCACLLSRLAARVSLLRRGHALLAYLDAEAGRLLRPALRAMPDGAVTNNPRDATADPAGHFSRLFSRGVSVLTAALQPEFVSAAEASAPPAAKGTDADAAAASAAKFWEQLRGVCWCPVRHAPHCVHLTLSLPRHVCTGMLSRAHAQSAEVSESWLDTGECCLRNSKKLCMCHTHAIADNAGAD